MSQAGISNTALIPPTVLTQFTTDVKDNTVVGPGTVIPSGSNVNLLGRSNNQNNNGGIRSDADADNSENLYVELTNRIQGTATTTDAATVETIYSFDLGSTPGTYFLDVKVIGFLDDGVSSLSAGFSSQRIIRTDGTAATEINASPQLIGEEGAMIGVVVANGVSGNDATLTAVGLAAKTIYWRALTTYIFVSA